MTARTQAEKARIEKRIRIERTVIPVVCVIAVAVFVVLCAVFGKKHAPDEAEALPSQAPFETVIAALQKELGGEITGGDGMASLSYKSSADDRYAAVSAYMKSGVLCLSVTHPFESAKVKPTPEPTEDIFGFTSPTATAKATDAPDTYVLALTEELVKCFSKVHLPLYDDNVSERIFEALSTLRRGEVKKTNVIFGVYMLKFNYSDDDGLLYAVCEPA